MLKKIFELKGQDFEKALSYETECFLGGVFKTFKNCDPFFAAGSLSPTQTPYQVTTNINSIRTIRAIVPVTLSSTSMFYVLADSGKAYYYDTINHAASDVSAQVTSTGTFYSAIVWKSKLVYSSASAVQSNSIPLNSANEVSILGSSTASVSHHPFCIGADRNLYMGNGNNVAKFTNEAGTTGNTTSVAASLETGYVVKQLINDGRYLVWIADNDSSGLGNGRHSCVVAFWDLAKSVFDQIYEFEDYCVGSAELMASGKIRIFTPSGIYETAFGLPPRLIVPFNTQTGSDLTTVSFAECPTNNNLSCVHKGNIALWLGNNGSELRLWGYGNKLTSRPDRLYQHNTFSTASSITAVGSDSNMILVGAIVSGSVCLFDLNNGSNNTITATVASGIILPQPYTFHHARVVTRSPISGGNSISLKILTAGGTKTIKASETKTNSTDSGERNLVFDHTAAGDGTDIRAFDDISDIQLTTNIPIRTLEIWGEPTDERGSYV